MNRLPDDLLILVCDSRKALFLKNKGTPIRPNLEILQHDENEGYAEEERDASHAGRRSGGGGIGATQGTRHAMEQVDLDKRHAEAYARRLEALLRTLYPTHHFKEIAVAAPPAFLGILRNQWGKEVANQITSEVPKRLTDLTPDEIAAALIES